MLAPRKNSSSVSQRRFCTNSRCQFTLCFALGRITPGTNLLAYCTGFGWVLRETPGAIMALLASSIPCAIMVAALTAFFDYWQASPIAQAAIHGAVAAAVGVTVKTCWTIAGPYYKGTGRLRVILAGGAAFALYQWAGPFRCWSWPVWWGHSLLCTIMRSSISQGGAT
jgi:chromate transporter